MRSFLLQVLLSLLLVACRASSAPTPVAAVAVEPLTLTDIDGRAHSVESSLAEGRPVVLVFWATWCSMCRAEMGHLAAASREHPELEFFGVVSGSDAAVEESRVRAIADEWFVPYPQVRDRDGSLAETFGVRGTPTVVVIGPGGEVLYQGNELPDWGSF